MAVQQQTASIPHSPPSQFFWFLLCSLSTSKMLPLKTSVIQLDTIPEKEIQIQGDSSATCCLLLLIKMSELFISLHCNLLVWHATETTSSCHQITKAPISNGRTGAFWYLERKEEKKKKRDAEAFTLLLLSVWEGERYNHSLYTHL